MWAIVNNGKQASIGGARGARGRRGSLVRRAASSALAGGAALSLLLAAAGCGGSGRACETTLRTASEADDGDAGGGEVVLRSGGAVVGGEGGGGVDLATANQVVDLIGKSATIMQGVTQQWLDYSNTKAAMGMAERDSRRQYRAALWQSYMNRSR